MLRHTADSRSWTARDSRCLARLFRSALGFFATQPAENIGQNQPWKQQTLAKFKSKGVISQPCLTSLLKFLKGDFSARDFLNSPKITHTSGWRMRYPCFPICVGVQSPIGSPYSRVFIYPVQGLLMKAGDDHPPTQGVYTLALLWGILQIRMRDNQRRKSINVFGRGDVLRMEVRCHQLRTWGFRMVTWEMFICFFFQKITHTHTPTKTKTTKIREGLSSKKMVTKGRASTINWVLLGNLVKVPGRCDLQWDHYTRVTGNLTMPWMDMNGIYMYVPYHAISH